LALLENIADQENSVPAMTILLQDSGKFIIGNSAGMVKRDRVIESCQRGGAVI